MTGRTKMYYKRIKKKKKCEEKTREFARQFLYSMHIVYSHKTKASERKMKMKKKEAEKRKEKKGKALNGCCCHLFCFSFLFFFAVHTISPLGCGFFCGPVVFDDWMWHNNIIGWFHRIRGIYQSIIGDIERKS